MTIQIGAKPDSGFDDPIGMLIDCHRRIERFLNILVVVADRARGRALNSEETEAVQAAVHYFNVGGQRHNADEEQSLFPRLRVKCSAEEIEKLSGLESDHQVANELHQAVEVLYAEWIRDRGLDSGKQQQLSSATAQLKGLYEEHIRTEESQVFPYAKAALSGDTVAAIGKEFEARRQ